MPEADWIREMREHYHRTGCYRTADVHRLLGDPRVGVTLPTRDETPSEMMERIRAQSAKGWVR